MPRRVEGRGVQEGCVRAFKLGELVLQIALHHGGIRKRRKHWAQEMGGEMGGVICLDKLFVELILQHNN